MGRRRHKDIYGIGVSITNKNGTSTVSENLSTGTALEENKSKENKHNESTSNKEDLAETQSHLALINKKILELSLKECPIKLPPSKFYNRYNLALRRDMCTAEFCSNRDGLTVCKDCKAAAYCCRDHQMEDFNTHKAYCFPVRDALKDLAEEEERLEADSGDYHLPANPFQTIRGRDQDAYDFTKWYTVPSADGFLTFHDEDVLESVDIFLNNPILLCHLIFVTQLKLKLLLDVRMLDREAKKHGSPVASFETKMEWVRRNAISDILYRRRDIVERDDWTDLKESLCTQVSRLYERVGKRNKHYWDALKDHNKCHTATPSSDFVAGSPEHNSALLAFTRDSWAECPHALTAVRVFNAICPDH
ncbi:hypothetical protein F4814DRAFT_453295 [Daldinia grandis]|nr:hypothetical protein F4814DRAFT_453295 [Daldinia grandis]